MIYIAGKGDGNVRYYELLNEDPYIFYLSQFISGAPQRGFGIVPKRGCVTAQCEIFRFYKLHATKDIIEPISMIVPRKSESFQDDIYPETQAPVPSLTGMLRGHSQTTWTERHTYMVREMSTNVHVRYIHGQPFVHVGMNFSIFVFKDR